tara:strand:- start:10533 stop:10805 length:273 start_codon:yes stop_codon:yes gene_type:complete
MKVYHVGEEIEIPYGDSGVIRGRLTRISNEESRFASRGIEVNECFYNLSNFEGIEIKRLKHDLSLRVMKGAIFKGDELDAEKVRRMLKGI